MKKEIINCWNGDIIELVISSKGNCFCPVCGVESIDKDWRPYDETGHPSYDVCSCGFEYGFDDSGVPPYEVSWENYRKKWISNEVEDYSFLKKQKQKKYSN